MSVSNFIAILTTGSGSECLSCASFCVCEHTITPKQNEIEVSNFKYLHYIKNVQQIRRSVTNFEPNVSNGKWALSDLIVDCFFQSSTFELSKLTLLLPLKIRAYMLSMQIMWITSNRKKNTRPTFTMPEQMIHGK